MGGQACVFYGAAEFSRDTDFAILAEPANLTLIANALEDLQAKLIALPPFELKFLERGHGVHFRCNRPDVADLRIDVLARMRGVDPFPALWARRVTVESPEVTYNLLNLHDLVKAKKTQRDKDWPMIRRLVDRHFFDHRMDPNPERVQFWLSELRSPNLLIEAASRFSADALKLSASRPVLNDALAADELSVDAGLDKEEKLERAADRAYWAPLKEELAQLRRERLKNK